MVIGSAAREQSAAECDSPDLRSIDLLLKRFAEHSLEYCVLHTLPAPPPSVVDLLEVAVQSSDVPGIQRLLDLLVIEGWLAIPDPCPPLGSFKVLLAQRQGDLLGVVAVQFIFDLSRLGLGSSEPILAAKRRQGMVWLAKPVDQFSYLLAKLCGGEEMTPAARHQLKTLKKQLGDETAGDVATSILGAIRAESTLADLCEHPVGRPERIGEGQVAGPQKQVRRSLPMAFRDFIRPSGLFIIVLGCDGVGKTTAIQQIRGKLGSLFSGCRTYHCRPFVLTRTKNSFVIGQPHFRPPRGKLLSSIFLFGFFIDCWLGYLLATIQFLSLSGLVIFDRYFHDVLIDPTRYRYGGPGWLPKLLSRLVPPFSPLFLVLDADEDEIFRRKQELPWHEIKRQRAAYARFAESRSTAHSVDCSDIRNASVNVAWTTLKHLSSSASARSF